MKLTVLVTIEVGDHAGKALARFAAEVAAMDEVMDFYRLAGDGDYFMRVVVPDAAAFDAFYKRLIETMPSRRSRHASLWKISNPKPLSRLTADAGGPHSRQSSIIRSCFK